jgi:methyl-accepting chemotaxis protein
MKNISVGTRLSIAFALVATVAMCSGIFDMLKIREINKGNSILYEISVQEAELARSVMDPGHAMADSLQTLAKQAMTQKEANDTLTGNAIKLGVLFIISTFIFAHGTGLIIKFSITRPLRKVVDTLKEGEKGDMRVRTGVAQKDEIGIVAKNVDEFFEKIQKILKNLLANSDHLADSSEKLSAISKQLANGAEETVSKSNIVTDTTEQMANNISAMAKGAEQASNNASEVAGAAEQMSMNVNTIAAAIEEMSASIRQIAGNTGEVRAVANEAAGKATEATEVMKKLSSAAKEIGEVTYMIKKIAEKTNLLALNATIEAATAGAAGKGFAVVANEINELAGQSAANADDITRRIEEIQNSTSNAVNVINDVSGIIIHINESVESIAGHADQQTKASNEIANNVSQANSGAKRVAGAIGEVAKSANEVSNNAGEAAKGAHNVSGNIESMSSAAKESASGALHVNKSAGDLAKIAGELRETVNLFKV